jgi:hypothetical protein
MNYLNSASNATPQYPIGFDHNTQIAFSNPRNGVHKEIHTAHLRRFPWWAEPRWVGSSATVNQTNQMYR